MLTLGHVGMGTGEVEPFDQIYTGSRLVDGDLILDDPDCIDALVIWGGEDISPTIYRDEVSRWTGATKDLSPRDIHEMGACLAAIKHKIPIIGICRGAQLVCALAGGRLIQHVEGHGWDHAIDTYDGNKLVTSSVHHQMMFPFDVDHQLLAWSSVKQSPQYYLGNNRNDPRMIEQKEPEIVWFPKIKALAIQGHPEFHEDPENDEFVQYCVSLVRKFIIEV